MSSPLPDIYSVKSDHTASTFASASLAIACLIITLLIDIFVYKRGYGRPPIRADGFGYYLYLPAIFIHHDIHFRFFHDPDFLAQIHAYYPFSDLDWAGLKQQDDGFANKYLVGTALMQLPFFLVAWIVARIGSVGPLSGFEFPFQVANCLSASAYFAASVYLLFRIVAMRTSASTARLCLLFALTTTNLVQYASYDGSLSHIYSFFLISGLCATAAKPDGRNGTALAFGLLLGLAVIVRPTNIVAVLLFLLFPKSATNTHHHVIRRIALVVGGSIIAASPQALIWQITSGNPIFYSYGDEGFNFLQPEVINYLLSVRKGVFFWHPAYFLMILSLLMHYRNYRQETIVFLSMIVLNLYLGSAWWNWWLGGSFGSRQTVDVLPTMIIATGSAFAVLKAARSSIVTALRAIVVVLATINLVLMYGYIAHKIPIDETTWEQYRSFWNSVPLLVRKLHEKIVCDSNAAETERWCRTGSVRSSDRPGFSSK